MNGITVLALVAVISSLLVGAFLIGEAEYDRYCRWRDLHSPMWEREEARRALSQPRVLR